MNRVAEESYIKLKEERYEDWFRSFLANTDQKSRMAKIFSHLPGALYKKVSNEFIECKILDVGCGEGTLAGNITIGLRKSCSKIIYYGIDRLLNYTESVTKKLRALDTSFIDIRQGNFLNKTDLEKLPNNTDIILAAHVAYYADNVTQFVEHLVHKSTEESILVFFHQSNSSIMSAVRAKYSLNTTISPEFKIKETLDYFGFNTITLWYPAVIRFPWDPRSLKESFYNNGTLIEGGPQEIKNLLEFVAHAPLEYLAATNNLSNFLNEISGLLEAQNNHLITWDILQIATKGKLPGIPSIEAATKQTSNQIINPPIELSSVKTEMKELIIGEFTPIELACYEGNFKIFKELERQLADFVSNGRPFLGLILASRNRHINIVVALLAQKEKFDLNVQTQEEGNTALHFAYHNGDKEIIKALENAGADKGRKNKAGTSPSSMDLKGKISKQLQSYIPFDSHKCIEGSEEIYSCKCFFDRKGEYSLSTLLEEVKNKKLLVLRGLSGVGKSEVAVEIAYNWTERGDGERVSFWLHAGSDLAFSNSLMNLTQSLGIEYGVEFVESKAITKIASVLNANKQKILFIFDDYWSIPKDREHLDEGIQAIKRKELSNNFPEKFLKKLKLLDNVKILITTRNSDIEFFGLSWKPIRLEALNEAEVYKYFSPYVIKKSINEVNVYTIVKKFSTMPWHLSIIARYLDSEGSSFQNLLDKRQEHTCYQIQNDIFNPIATVNTDIRDYLMRLAYLGEVIPYDIRTKFNSKGVSSADIIQSLSLVKYGNAELTNFYLHAELSKILVATAKCLNIEEEILYELGNFFSNSIVLNQPAFHFCLYVNRKTNSSNYYFRNSSNFYKYWNCNDHRILEGLGSMYYRGQGVEQNRSYAIDLWNRTVRIRTEGDEEKYAWRVLLCIGSVIGVTGVIINPMILLASLVALATTGSITSMVGIGTIPSGELLAVFLGVGGATLISLLNKEKIVQAIKLGVALGIGAASSIIGKQAAGREVKEADGAEKARVIPLVILLVAGTAARVSILEVYNVVGISVGAGIGYFIIIVKERVAKVIKEVVITTLPLATVILALVKIGVMNRNRLFPLTLAAGVLVLIANLDLDIIETREEIMAKVTNLISINKEKKDASANLVLVKESLTYSGSHLGDKFVFTDANLKASIQNFDCLRQQDLIDVTAIPEIDGIESLSFMDASSSEERAVAISFQGNTFCTILGVSTQEIEQEECFVFGNSEVAIGNDV